jgi:hypothetical protein
VRITGWEKGHPLGGRVRQDLFFCSSKLQAGISTSDFEGVHPKVTENDLQLPKASIDKLVTITCSDGEVLLAKVHAVSDEDEDVIYDLVSTTKESHYEKRDEQPAYLIPFGDIDRVEPFQRP